MSVCCNKGSGNIRFLLSSTMNSLLRYSETFNMTIAAQYLKPFSLYNDGLVLYDELVYIPNDENIKLQILRMSYDSKMAGHLEPPETLEIVSHDDYWPRMQ